MKSEYSNSSCEQYERFDYSSHLVMAIDLGCLNDKINERMTGDKCIRLDIKNASSYHICCFNTTSKKHAIKREQRNYEKKTIIGTRIS